jgi:hypothetical protein
MPETPKNPKKPAALEAATPKIPGVPPPKPKKPTPPKPIAKPGAPVVAQQKAPGYLWAIGIVVLLVFVAGSFWLMSGSKRQTSAAASVNANAPTAAAKPLLVVNSTKLPVAPGVIAVTDELTQPWSAKKFLFSNAKGKSFAAMLVKLPDNSYWAFSLREPYGSCELEYITDLDKLRTQYNFTATHPMVGDPCSHTVFDLASYGPGPSGEVRGEIVAGTGVRPPLAIEVEVNGTKILATRAEADILH